MNQELRSFVEAHLNSILKIDLLSFFQRNPYVVGRVEDLATCLGVEAGELAGDLEDLVEAGILPGTGRYPGRTGAAGPLGPLPGQGIRPEQVL